MFYNLLVSSVVGYIMSEMNGICRNISANVKSYLNDYVLEREVFNGDYLY